ncbi:MAG TPA: hypothetical protein VMU67_05780 [Steroidobacteraceae bacterium]|nr:hypothetical protein [Steroidobacteraceae bacterium]
MSARTKRGHSARLRASIALALLAAGSVAIARADPPATAAAQPPAKLNLDAPPINHVLSPSQIETLTADHDDDPPPEEVTVESRHYRDPVPLGQLRALPWALMHPTQAWRIFTPITDDDD